MTEFNSDENLFEPKDEFADGTPEIIKQYSPKKKNDDDEDFDFEDEEDDDLPEEDEEGF